MKDNFNLTKKKNMHKIRNQDINKKNQKIFLIIWIISISNGYIVFFINLNPINTNLNQRADFFSFVRSSKFINEENSNLIYGSEIEGTVMTSIKVPQEYIKKEFELRIEADTKSIWNYTLLLMKKNIFLREN